MEHASDPEVFINSLLDACQDGWIHGHRGTRLFRAIENHDYTTFWEEHFVYFTSDVQNLLRFRDCHAVYECFEYAFE
jgi:hypothetical protein